MAKFLVNPDLKEINWEDDTSYLFFNLEGASHIQRSLTELQTQIENRPGRIWVMTSGSQGFPKCVGLTKTGFLKSAKTVAKNFNFKSDEVCLNSLPIFHVGGLSVIARAFVAGQRVVAFEEWSPKEFQQALIKERAQWTSLVPTQIYDLVQLDLPAAQSLRGVFVGGGPMRSELYHAARKLGWPLLPTYGMTEASSQIATANMVSLKVKSDPNLEILEHIEVSVNDEGRLGIKGESVTDVWAQFESGVWKLSDPRDANGVYWTQDSGVLKAPHVALKGRADDIKKIRGELVSLSQLQGRLDQSLLELRKELGPVIHFIPDPRTGYKVVAVIEPAHFLDFPEVSARLKDKCAPYEKVERVYILPKIPRSELGKIKRAELEKELLV